MSLKKNLLRKYNIKNIEVVNIINSWQMTKDLGKKNTKNPLVDIYKRSVPKNKYY